MSASAKSWSIAVIAVFAMVLAVIAPAQTFPTAKGSNQRIGSNGNPATYNPGAAVLQWFYPSATANTQIETNESSYANFAGVWLAPIFGGAASDSFVFNSTGNPITDPIEGINSTIPYLYANAIPCDPITDNPLIPQAFFAGQLSIASWTVVTPLIQGNTANDYALYVWLPVGPTIGPGLGSGSNYSYPAEFTVFEIDYGTGLHYVDVVDRNQAGAGFVRLGNGGLPSTVLYHYDGVNPIVIHEYNTIPRDSTGALAGVGSTVDSTGAPVPAFDIYANAVQASVTYGTIYSSPVIGNNLANLTTNPTGGANNVYVATNLNVNVLQNGSYVTESQGQLTAFQSNIVQGLGIPNWTFSPIDQGSVGLTVDEPNANIAQSPGWNTGNALTFPGFTAFIGPDFLYRQITNNLATDNVVTYNSNTAVQNMLAEGSYDVLMWTPGVVAGGNFAQSVQVEIDEGAAQTFLTVDLTALSGYQRLGGRRFVNTQAEPLVVKITNYSTSPTDLGKNAYADAVRFVGTANLQINSTPVNVTIPIGVQTLVGGIVTYSTQMKSVVITAGEDGRIYCLDAYGRGDGTTDVYWAYPSLPDPTSLTWTDPNNSATPPQPTGYLYANERDGLAGVTDAIMPSGFDLSSALVQEVPVGSGHYFLYITSNNGRVYCIDTAGRGDFNTATRTPGTTARIWTFPNDYRPDNPGIPSVPSALGATNASLLYNTNASGPTIFVPTAQGRIYALDAAGNIAQSTTTTKWAFPPTTSPVVGPFNATPVIAQPKNSADAMLYAGTERENGTQIGQFFGIDVETGLSKWVFQGGNTSLTDVADDFEGGPAVAFGGIVGDVAHPDYIFVANENGYVYALDADNNGALLWETNELDSGASAPLMYTNLNVFSNTAYTNGAILTGAPTVMVPTDSGGFYGLFASQAATNINGGKLDYGYLAAGNQIVAGMASSTTIPLGTAPTYMYGADNLGYTYAFNGGLPGGNGGFSGPGSDVGVPNDPETQEFAQAKVGFYQPTSYNQIRLLNLPDYTTYTAASNFLVRTPPAFDFGEVLYVMVYNFPSEGPPLNLTPQTSVTFTVNVEGRTLRQTVIQARQFSGAGIPTYTNPVTNQTVALDGFAILAFPLQPSGVNAMAPGDGSISYSIQENVSSVTGNRKTFFNSGQTLPPFTIANPLGIAMALDPNNKASQYYGLLDDSLGADSAAFASASNPENAFNGSIAYGSALLWNPSNMIASAGVTSHGGTASRTVYAYDRSLMATLTGPDVPSISNLRVDRTNLAWQNGYAAVVNPIGGTNGLYQGTIPILEQFEDYPTQFPNISFDYGDIPRQYLLATSNPTGASQNPLFSPVTLAHPIGLFMLDSNGNETNQPNTANWPNRLPNPTPIQLDANVPKFQPANLSSVIDTVNNTVSNGYESVLDIFTDSNGSGKLQTSGGMREAYRTFNFGVGVGVDEHMTVMTPNVDLGSLAEGTGLLVNPAAGEYNVRPPWFDAAGINSTPIYQSFQAVNDGNVNLLNPRIAHGYNNPGFNPVGWPFYSTSVDDLAYLDGEFFLYSDLDPNFSLTGPNIGNVSTYGPNPRTLSRGEVFVQKPRVTDNSGNYLKTNPVNRSNGNIGTSGGIAENPDAPTGLDPRVAVTPPIGFPVGSYSQIVRLIEDRGVNYNVQPTVDDYNLSILLGTQTSPGEVYADPTFLLSFNVRESQLTNTSTRNTASMADQNLTATGTPFLDANVEPAGMRDRAFGNLFFAWSSNRPAINNGAIPSATDYVYRIYSGTLDGSVPAVNQTANNDASPLNEQAFWTSANNTQWFATAGPYPVGPSSANGAAVNALFGTLAGDHVLGTGAGEEDTVRFGQPALPVDGLVNPFVTPSNSSSDYNHGLMAFTGDADIQTATGRVASHRLFVATVTPQQNAAAAIGAPAASANDTDMPKGKPSIVQVGLDQAVVFYPGTTGGRSRLYYELYNNGTFSTTIPVDTGVGFDSVSDPSAMARLYEGADPTDIAQDGNMIELSFSAKLRGRPNNEIFMCRIPTDVNGAPNKSNSNQELISFFAPRTVEQLEAQPERGVYRAVGVGWNVNTQAAIANIDLGITIGNGLPNSIIIPGSPRLLDPQSGILTLKTTMGTVYVDTFEGTVRFANSIPGTNYKVYADYQPKFLRISVTRTSALTGPNLLWDYRRVGTPNYDNNFNMYDRYWYVGNAHANLQNNQLLNDRYVVMYNRSAAGPGQSARPLIETLRLGLQLPLPVPTTNTGDVDFTAFGVNGNAGPYQVDPTTGRIYFTAVDEDKIVSIALLGTFYRFKVEILPERDETPVQIEQAVNENHVAAFIDPFDPAGPANRRPDLVWLLWSSTRSGPSDIFFETIAPILWPVKQ